MSSDVFIIVPNWKKTHRGECVSTLCLTLTVKYYWIRYPCCQLPIRATWQGTTGGFWEMKGVMGNSW